MVKSFLKIKIIAIPLCILVISLACTSNQNENKQKSYQEIKNEISKMKDSMHKIYQNDNCKDSIIDVTKNYLFKSITTQIMPAWNGTTWDFNGISEEPKKGAIACGMFVTIVLKDAGFNISRIKSGQLASEVLIKKLSKNIKRFSNSKMEKVIDYIKSNDDGIYIVGLDIHIGFIVKNKNDLKFVHSNYYNPHVKVMSQKLTETSPLTDSHYRILGKILDNEMVEKWIKNEKID